VRRAEWRADLRLYVLADCAASDERVRAWAEGGVTALQLRDKAAPAGVVQVRAMQLAALCRELGLLFILNDRPEWQAASGADGAHVGQSDQLEAARQSLGPGAILGVSVVTPQQARVAMAAGADYLGVGPVFPTGSKADAAAAIGTEGLAAVRAAVPGAPVVAIGGITAGNAGAVLAAGADGVAVISALAGPNPREAAAALALAMRQTKL
jgi:thiamine-phosphate pyrophosphorylase